MSYMSTMPRYEMDHCGHIHDIIDRVLSHSQEGNTVYWYYKKVGYGTNDSNLSDKSSP